MYAVQVADDLGGGGAPLAYVENSALLIVNGDVTGVTPTSANPLIIPLTTALQSGESIAVVYVAQVSGAIADSVQDIANTVLATARQGSATGDVVNADPATVTIVREGFAQINIIKSVDKAVIASGDTLTYTFVIENSGNIPATNVVITDTLPAGFEVTSIQSETDGVVTVCSPADYTVGADNTLILPTGGGVTIIVLARTAAGNGVTTVTVVGTVTG